MSSAKNYLYRDFAAGVYLSEAQNPIPPTLTHCMRLYNLLFHIGKEGMDGGELNQREGERLQFTKLGRKY